MSSTNARTNYTRPIILPEIDPASAEAPLEGEELHEYYKQYVEREVRKYAELKDLDFNHDIEQRAITDMYRVESGELHPGAVKEMVPG